MRYLKLFESFTDTNKVYHVSSKDQLEGLLAGIKTDNALSWGQGSGFYVNTSEKWCEEQEGVGSRMVDLMIELEADTKSDNFDVDYEMNYGLSKIVETYINKLKNMFDDNFTISSNDSSFLIFGNKINKDDFSFEPIKFRNEDIGIIPKSSKEDWCYLPIDPKSNKVKIVNNIYGAPITKDFMERLDKFNIKKMIKNDLLKSSEQVALRYIGPLIKPKKYKFKKDGKWGEWITNKNPI
jgi:hypothetical protein